MKRFVDLAYKRCPVSDHAEHKMFCMIIKGGAILSAEANKKWNHAEARAIRPHMNYKGAALLVVRENMRISKPCKNCMDKIRKAKIKSITYVDINTILIVKERVV